MRINDPRAAPMVPVLTSLEWSYPMPPDERIVTLLSWERVTDSIIEITGQMTQTGMTRRPLDQGDREWLKAIGARQSA